MENKKEKILIGLIITTIVSFLVVGSFMITSSLLRNDSYVEEAIIINPKTSLMVEENKSNFGFMTLENINTESAAVAYLSTEVKTPKITWQTSKKSVKKGEKFTVKMTVKNAPKNFVLYWEDISTSNIKILDMYGSNNVYTIKCQASKVGKGVIKYIPSGSSVSLKINKNTVSTKKVQATWKIPNTTFTKGEKFNVELTLKNTPQNFQLYWEDFSISGIKVNDIYSVNTSGKYVLECQASTVGKGSIKYIPTGESVSFTINKKLTPVQKAKATFSLPMTNIYVGDSFKVNLELKNVQDSYQVYWEDFSSTGINICNIYKNNGKYVLECQASRAGKGTIKFIPTGDNVSIDIYPKYNTTPSVKAIWNNVPNSVYKGEEFNLNLSIQNMPYNFQLYWEDIDSYGMRINNIYGSNGKYTLVCQATQTGTIGIRYKTTGNYITIKAYERVMEAIWEVPNSVTKGNYFYVDLTLINAPPNYVLKSEDIGTSGMALSSIKSNGNKYIIECLANDTGNLIIKFLPTGDYINVISK